jgi:molecular chaperone HtpG
VKKVLSEKEKVLGETLSSLQEELKACKSEADSMEKLKKGKKDEEIPQADKEKLEDLHKQESDLEESQRNQLKEFGKNNPLAKQLVDLALLANGLLKGADLDKFVKRSVELIK